MRKAKKIICGLLSMLTILSLAVVPAFASGAGYSTDLIGTTPTQAEVEALPRPSDFITPKANKGYTSFATADYNFNHGNNDGEGYFKVGDVYQIKDYTDMVAISILGLWAGDQFTNNPTYYLANDIDMSAVSGWHAIADNTGVSNNNGSTPYFHGTFDGRGFAIKNLLAEGNDENGLINVALFGCIKGATIKNLVIDSTCSFTYTGTNTGARTASVAAFGNTSGTYNYWNIQNVQNNANVSATVGAVGGLMADSGAQNSAWFDGFVNCTNNGDVIATGVSTNAGGIIGYVARAHARIRNCINSGDVTATGYAGGIAAGATPSYYYEIYDCQNSGTVTALYAGGILGALEVGSTVMQGCTNTGRIVTANAECGLAGQIYGYKPIGVSKPNVTGNTENGTLEAIDAVRALGYQKTLHETEGEDGKTYRTLRLVGMLPATEAELAQYEYVGLSITARYVVSETLYTKPLDGRATEVYESLEAMNGATGLDRREGWYYFAVILKDIPTSLGTVELDITPYSKKIGEATVYGCAKSASVYLSEIKDPQLNIGDPTVVVQPGTYAQYGWGCYQFVHILPTVNGNQYIYWGMGNDAPAEELENKVEGINQLVTDDGGQTWREKTAADVTVSNAQLSNGSYLTGLQGGNSRVQSWISKYDAYIQIPEQNVTNHHIYFAEDIAEFDTSLKATSVNPLTGETTTFDVTVNWPYAPMTAFTLDGVTYVRDFQSAFGMGMPTNIISQNGTLYLCIYSRGFDSSAASREEALFKYADALSIYVFKSTDDARTWDYVSQVSVNDEVYERSKSYSGVFEGFNEPMMEVMPDGSIVMLMRSGSENQPSYIVRSTDGCQTWSAPAVFDEVGVKPQILTLECGVTIAAYGREGLYVRATADPSGLAWEDPIRIALNGESLDVEAPLSDYYTCLYALDSTTVLMLYTDFYYPDAGGGDTPKKTILSCIITVQDASE